MSFDVITQELLDDHSCTIAHIRIEKWGTLLFDRIYSTGKLIDSPVFDIASLTKLFTTTAILHLITKGALRENTTIREIFPEYPSQFHHITVSSLLTHTSGILAWYPFYTQRETPFEMILQEIGENHPLVAGMIYSDINFMICGKIIEHISSLSLEQAMQNLVFNPLSLEQTTYHPDTNRTIPTEFGNRIEQKMVEERNLHFDGFRPTDKAMLGECNDGNAYYYFNGVAGHAGIFSTAEDIARLLSLYVDGHTPAYISSYLIAKATTDQGMGRGYGFQMGENYPHSGVGHTGFTGTYAYLNPKLGYTISLLTNRLNVPQPRAIQSYRNAIVNEAISLYSI
ncbi:MAG: beta-lactamase family protein [Sphaerochaeta sp.]|nr:beta-lactamase family protein [Sphaerochaeta sp.]